MNYREELHFLQTKGKSFEKVRMKFMLDKIRMNSTYGKFVRPGFRYTPEPLPRHRSGVYGVLLECIRRMWAWL